HPHRPRVDRSGRAATPEERAENRTRADQRARSRIRRLVLSYELTHFITLTFAAEVTDLKQAWDEFALFIRRARRSWGHFHWIAVPAIQESGLARGAPGSGTSTWPQRSARPTRNWRPSGDTAAWTVPHSGIALGNPIRSVWPAIWARTSPKPAAAE